MSVVDLPAMPGESPVQMPIQSLREGRLTTRPLPSAPTGMAWRRAFIVTTAAVLTIFATYQIWWLLRIGGIDVLEGLSLIHI